MMAFSRIPLVITILGAVLLGGSAAAFRALGGMAPFTDAASDLWTPQVLNVLGFLTGMVLMVVGGRRSVRTLPTQLSPRELRSVVATLQSLKHGAYRATPAALPHLDALLQLVWQRDNAAATLDSGAES